jgi:hypothetical protein
MFNVRPSTDVPGFRVGLVPGFRVGPMDEQWGIGSDDRAMRLRTLDSPPRYLGIGLVVPGADGQDGRQPQWPMTASSGADKHRQCVDRCYHLLMRPKP